MNIFVINSGSSSIKYQLIQMPTAHLICSGLVERIGFENAVITHKVYRNQNEEVIQQIQPLANHADGLQAVNLLLTNAEKGVIKNPNEIHVVGHRVVHGGEHFAATTIVSDAVKEQIKNLFSLAPLHNPANLLGIEVAEKIFTQATQIAVFDTAFHQTIPAVAYRYAIPNQLYNEHGIRLYGFHGTSHKYVAEQTIAYLQNPSAKIITIHLGNGCSVAAIKDGKCVDTSMGFGPMNGLVMGTRSGDIDQSVIFYLVNQLGYSIQDVNTLLNKQSGMFGLTGLSDMRDIKTAIEKGDAQAKLAYEMYAYRIKKYIGSYVAVLNGIDALVFTAGVGENDALTRSFVLENLGYLGITIDENRNATKQVGIKEIQQTAATVKVLVVPTNEELEIATQCFNLVGAL